MKAINNYVATFCFDETERFVALIEKNKPAWQAGRLNGIGGKIEEGETIFMAAKREFEEETGCSLPLSSFIHYASLFDRRGDALIHFFKNTERLSLLRSTTPEQVIILPLARLHYDDQVIPNLKWLIPMALEYDKGIRHGSGRPAMYQIEEI